MMKGRVLITGGAGFIGSHVTDELLNSGYAVRIIDNLNPQVHGPIKGPPDYLNPEAEFIRKDIRNIDTLRKALEDVTHVCHLAAEVGVGQSMYEIEKYTAVNTLATATLLQALIERPVEKLVVASSMSIYGEGLYQSRSGEFYTQTQRTPDHYRQGRWEIDDLNGDPLFPVPTPEQKGPSLSSVYALTKYDQEQMALIIGRAYQLPVTALRFFNTYGPRQALSNPYTGVLAIFSSRLLNDKPPLIFEDGRQKRDFVSVHDVARACRLALESPTADDQVFNIGSGSAFTILEVAEAVGRVMGKEDIVPEITGRYRAGDIRHCFADISLAENRLNYTPQVSLEEGLEALALWLDGRTADDHVEYAASELKERGLTI
ncbi:MAG: NAD-dependent epimerase/dehydratase family protein [Desulfococcaceae bacterium]